MSKTQEKIESIIKINLQNMAEKIASELEWATKEDSEAAKLAVKRAFETYLENI